jgi:hypothetical protein
MTDQTITKTETKKKKPPKSDGSFNVRVSSEDRVIVNKVLEATGYPSASALFRDIVINKQYKTKFVISPDIDMIGTYLSELFDLIPNDKKENHKIQKKIMNIIRYIYKDLDVVKLSEISEEGEGYDW